MNRLSMHEVKLITKFVIEDTNLLILQCFKLVSSHVSIRDDIPLTSVNIIRSVLKYLTDYIRKLNIQYSSKALKFIYRTTDIVYQTFERYYINFSPYNYNVRILDQICRTIKKNTTVNKCRILDQ